MRTTLLIALLALLPTFANAAVITYARTDFPSGRPPERLMAPSSTDADLYEEIKQTGNALHSYQAYRQAGERAEGSTTGADYSSVAGEWKATTVQTNATGDITVYNGPAIVRMVRVRFTTDAGVATTNTAGIILVKDGTTVEDGAAAAKTPGSTIYDGLDGVQFRTSVVVNFANIADNPASSGKVEVLYRPLPAAVNW